MLSIQDEDLIFLISLPRSGSTLLQHILASHSKIAATAEPWVLFPAALALRKGALVGDYNANIGLVALSEFLGQLEDGEDRYYTAVRTMALDLYGAFVTKQGRQRFLDKTSRYYLILPEIFRIFPKARYVFLLRNPLAVLASYLDYMVFGNIVRLGEAGIRNDLFDGYRLIRQGIRYFGDDAIVVRYEDLVENPENTISVLCEKLKLDFEPKMLNYGEQVGLLPGKMVDPKSIQKHQAPVKDHLATWQSRFSTRQERHLARAFLAHLGTELVNSLGYSFEQLESSVAAPGWGWRPLVRWNLLMLPPGRRTRIQKSELGITSAWQKDGLGGISKRLGKRGGKMILALFRQALRVCRKRVKTILYARPRPRWATAICKRDSSYHAYPPQAVSSEYQLVENPKLLASQLEYGWRTRSVADRQLAAYRPLLDEMHRGNPRQDFKAAAQALCLTKLNALTLLEVGCGNGYYSEVLSFLTRRPIQYTGLDYSQSMVESARATYAQHQFVVASATELPYPDQSFDVVWSGTVLMHLVNYERAIEEASRVSHHFCIFHSTPVLSENATTFLTKRAYGTPVVEVILNQLEFESLLHNHGLVIRHILESLPYQPGNVIKGAMHTLTYVCEKVDASESRT